MLRRRPRHPARGAAALLAVLALALAAAALGGTAGAAAAEVGLYVAPGGDDSGPGTLARPFATLGRAQAAVRAATPGMDADVVVNLRGGTYRVRSPLVLDAAAGDSGENGHRVVYQAYGYGTPAQERPVLSGGRAIGGWKLVDRGRHLWRAEVGALATRQLYRDGRLLRQGTLAAIPGKVSRSRRGYVTTSAAPRSWADPADLELVFTTVGYSQGTCGVAGVEPGPGRRTTITMDQPCFTWVRQLYTETEPGEPSLVAPSLRNSRSFLAAGEWAIERGRRGHNRIYYRAAAGEDPGDHAFLAPATRTLVRGAGTRAAPLHDLSFRGLGFEDTTWTAPNGRKGFVQVIGDYYYDGGSPSGSLEEPTAKVRFVPAALSFEHTRGLLLEADRFAHLGAEAVSITGGAGNVLRGNELAESAGGGLKLSGLDDGSDTGNLIEDNWIHGIGLEYGGTIGIYLEDVVDSSVRHNQLDHLPYSGIAQTISEARGRGVEIAGNRIFDVVRTLMDGGAIYTSGSQGPSWAAGARIEGNVVHGAINPRFSREDPQREVGAPNGIYTDVGADHITLRRNLVYDNHQSWGGVGPRRMRFEANFWDDDRLLFYGPTGQLRLRGNTLLPRRDPRRRCEGIAACEAIRTDAGLEPRWREALRPARR